MVFSTNHRFCEYFITQIEILFVCNRKVNIRLKPCTRNEKCIFANEIKILSLLGKCEAGKVESYRFVNQ